MTAIQALGNFGEESAASYLMEQGFRVLNRNWRHGHLEIDLVCLQGDTIVFVEVKTRRHNICGGPAGAITLQKKYNISKAAQVWLNQHKAWFKPCRFDVVCVTGTPDSFFLQHYPDAFSYVPTLDSRNANWQY